MEDFKITKEFADNLMTLKGNIRGGFFVSHFRYVKNLKGDEGVKLVEERLERLGYPTKEKEVSNVKWYPEALASLMILATAEVFNLTKEDVFQMGKESIKTSFIIRVLMSHFLNLEKAFKEAPKYWRKNYDFGNVEIIGFGEKEKHCTISIKNFRLAKDAEKHHPWTCVYHTGYFSGIIEMLLPNKKIKIKHEKCFFSGQDEMEFKITWD